MLLFFSILFFLCVSHLSFFMYLIAFLEHAYILFYHPYYFIRESLGAVFSKKKSSIYCLISIVLTPKKTYFVLFILFIYLIFFLAIGLFCLVFFFVFSFCVLWVKSFFHLSLYIYIYNIYIYISLIIFIYTYLHRNNRKEASFK